MKHKPYAMVVILLMGIAMVAGGCSVFFPEQKEQSTPEAAPGGEDTRTGPSDGQEARPQQVETNAYGEEVRPAQKTTTVRQPVTREGETEQPVPFDRRAEGQMLTLDSYKLSRISRDKGMVDEVTFTVRNTGSKTLTPHIILWFKMQSNSDASIPDITEKVYDFPQLKPGYKVTKKYPLNMRFHYLEGEKTFTLKVRDRYVSPPKDLDIITRTFIPLDEMENMEISWT